MRKSREDTAASRERITDAAARLFREGGITGTGVAEVMNAAGMTHGGFYRHFPSKEALIVEAMTRAVAQTIGTLDGLEGTALADALRGYLATYLSVGHVARPGIGCPIAATAEEGARAASEVREVYGTAVMQLQDALRRAFPDRVADPDAEAWRVISLCIGAVTIARTLDDARQIETLLNSALSSSGMVALHADGPDPD